jgi:hypothetical protein
MRKLLLSALLVLGLGATAAIPMAANDPAATQATATRHDPPGRGRPAQPFLVVGLTDDQTLVAFASNNPRKPTTLGRISGLQGDRRLVGIDCRVADSTTYGVGDNGGVYRLRLGDAPPPRSPS